MRIESGARLVRIAKVKRCKLAPLCNTLCKEQQLINKTTTNLLYTLTFITI